MDWADIARRAAAVRELTHTIDGRSFTLRLPTTHELRIMVLARGEPGTTSDQDLVAWEHVGREVIERGIVGWSGVLLSDLLPGETDDPVEWAAGGVPVLLDAQPTWASELRMAMNRALTERAERLKEAQKN